MKSLMIYFKKHLCYAKEKNFMLKANRNWFSNFKFSTEKLGKTKP